MDLLLSTMVSTCKLSTSNSQEWSYTQMDTRKQDQSISQLVNNLIV